MYLREQSYTNEFFEIEGSFQSLSNIAKPYRYGFQGQEKDDEVKGEGNSINYKYRMHDPRIGRFFAVDPLAYQYPHNSPYAFSENRVIDGLELEGLEVISFHGDVRAFGLILTVSDAAGIMFDSEGIALFNTAGIGLGLGLGVSGGGGVSVSGAESIEDLDGWGYSIGGLVVAGPAGAEVSVDGPSDGSSGGVTVAYSGGAEMGVFYEVNYTTSAYILKYSDVARNMLGDDASREAVESLGKDIFKAFKSKALKGITKDINNTEDAIEDAKSNARFYKAQQEKLNEQGVKDFGRAQWEAEQAEEEVRGLQQDLKELQEEKKKVEEMEYSDGEGG
ncbi:MAG: hypothetical protein COA32_14810 [Fluviicola sp.]|nr:MAG: hypothetical protein COA32_14810 [Fluviicola sp.]